MMGNFMSLYLPVLLGYFAYSYASGLALYFVVSNLLGILQFAAMGKLDLNNLLPFKKQS